MQGDNMKKIKRQRKDSRIDQDKKPKLIAGKPNYHFWAFYQEDPTSLIAIDEINQIIHSKVFDNANPTDLSIDDFIKFLEGPTDKVEDLLRYLNMNPKELCGAALRFLAEHNKLPNRTKVIRRKILATLESLDFQSDY